MQSMFDGVDRCSANAAFGCDCLHRARISTNSVSLLKRQTTFVTTFITGLLFRRSPTNIARLVMTILVRPAVDALIRRSFASMRKKRLVVWETNFNTLSAVVLPILRIWIGATAQHINPSSISFRPSPASGMPMCKGFGSSKLDQTLMQIAATRQGSSTSQSVTTNSGLLTAIADAKPPNTFGIFRSVALKNSQSTKAARCEINKLGHASLLRMFAQVAGSVLTHRPAALGV